MKEKVKISVITVCYNAVANIDSTIQSVLNQSYNNIEYIIIDGASNDGTIDAIRGYQDDRIHFISEKDNGLYDAMNKGIQLANGDYIIFMNAGDLFFNNQVLEEIFGDKNNSCYDIIFGDSVARDEDGTQHFKYANPDPEVLLSAPTYRHGASFVRTELHKDNLFDLSKIPELGYALDYNCIYTLKKNGATFKKVDLIVLDYENEGTSNNLLKSTEYIYKITHPSYSQFNLRIFKIKSRLKILVRNSKIIKWAYYLLIYLMNYIGTFIPIWSIRKQLYKIMGIKIGDGSVINMNQYINTPRNLCIGCNTHINRGCLLDARANCIIGNNVSISYGVSIMTGGHDVNSSNFRGVYLPIRIEDNVWIGVNAVILQNVTIGEGAVVAAGAVVTKNIPPYTIVGGIPAKVIGKRREDLNYKCKWVLPFT